jgi:hypothetical protein
VIREDGREKGRWKGISNLLFAESTNMVLFAGIRRFRFISSFSRFAQLNFDDFRLPDQENRVLFAARNNSKFGAVEG